ncbi:hypothetical protein SAMN05444157_1494 [Frankineae bacterium MT45]|nr:hypothetical protein SAMN05444157_1494 [Frankineae bacterium MT45]
MRRIHSAAMRRLRSTQGRDADDSGFAMIFVLVVIAMVTTAVSAMLVVTASEIKPTQASVDSASASAAAQAGVQAYFALLNNTSAAGCGSVTMGNTCPALTTTTYLQAQLGGTDGQGKSWYSAKITNNYVKDGFARVYSIGCSTGYSTTATGVQTCAAPGVARAIQADISAQVASTKLAYYSTYETVGSGLLAQEFPKRSIALPDTSILSAANQALGSQGVSAVSWDGASPPTGSPTTYNSTQQVCDSLWYNNAAYDAGGQGRAISTQSLLGFDWTESGTTNDAATTAVTHNGQCQVSLTSKNTFTGPIQSMDAFYLSGTPTVVQSSTATGRPAVTTGWNQSTYPAPVGNLYNTDQALFNLKGLDSRFIFTPAVVPNADSAAFASNPIQSTTQSPSLPHNLPDIEPTAYGFHYQQITSGPAQPNTCVYYGPTRVLLNGVNASGAVTATVTSPMTASNPANPCYTSSATQTLTPMSTPPIDAVSGKLSSPGTTGVVGATVNLSSSSTQAPTIIVRSVGTSSSWAATTGSASAGSPIPSVGGVTKTNSNPIFTVGTTLTSPIWTWPSEPARNSPAWNQFSSDINASGTGTGSGTAKPTYPDWAGFKPLAVSGSPAGLAASLNKILPDSTGGKAQPTGAASWRYRAVNETTVKQDGTATDPLLYTGQSGSTANIERQTSVGTTTCTGYQNSSGCWAQQSCTIIAIIWTCFGGTSACDATACGSCTSLNQQILTSWLGLGTGIKCVAGGSTTTYAWSADGTGTQIATVNAIGQTTSTFPLAADRTVYDTFDSTGANGPGDLYVAGKLGAAGSQSISLIAENDIVTTGSITPSDATSGVPAANEPAAALIAGQNVRIYHPVGCLSSVSASALAATSAGFCPNDTTGLFNYTTIAAPLGLQHPSKQYINLQQDQTQSGTTCSPITVDGAVFGLGDTTVGQTSINDGSFTGDNPDRGTDCSYLTLNGSVLQQHRGSMGTTLEDGTGTGYSLVYNYDANLPAKLTGSWLPPTMTDSIGSPWTLITTSSASAVSGGS